ncbi:hypothetical protein CVT24_007342, partial [Panaeolus cyanescens]
MEDTDEAVIGRLAAQLRHAAGPSRDSSIASRSQPRSPESSNSAWKHPPVPIKPPMVPPKDLRYSFTYPRQLSKSSNSADEMDSTVQRHTTKRNKHVSRSLSTTVPTTTRGPLPPVPTTPTLPSPVVVIPADTEICALPSPMTSSSSSNSQTKSTDHPGIEPRTTSSRNGSTSTKSATHDSSSVLAHELDALKREIERLKEKDLEAKRAMRKQNKKIEELKTELQSVSSSLQAKDSELTTVKSKSGQQEELITTIEHTIQCQICMDLPHRPFAISPCGHILCLPCLQEWFKKAPPTLDDMEDMVDPDELTDPEYILRRTKTCPTCRAHVKRKPAPVFMIKNVAAAVLKYRTPPTTSAVGGGGSFALLGAGADAAAASTQAGENNEDPWDGIFESSSSEGERDDDDEDDGTEYGSSDSDYGIFHEEAHMRYGGWDGFEGSDDEEEEDDGEQSDGEEGVWHEGLDGMSDIDEEGERGGGRGRGDERHDDVDDNLFLAFQMLGAARLSGPEPERRTAAPFGSIVSPVRSRRSSARSSPVSISHLVSPPSSPSRSHSGSPSHSRAQPRTGGDAEYVLPRYEAPCRPIPENVDLLALFMDGGMPSPRSAMTLLKRGCSVGMLQSFEVTYEASEGVIIHLRSLKGIYVSDGEESGDDDDDDEDDYDHDDRADRGDLQARNRLFVGWNVQLEDSDEDGEEFVGRMLRELKWCPERWVVGKREGVRGGR